MCFINEIITICIKGLSLNTASIYCWSDSMIALYWIKNNKEWKNRVNIIKKVVKSDNWHYISCSDNLLLTINCGGLDLNFYLKNKESWPEDKFVSDETDEMRSDAKSNVAVNVKFIDHPKQEISAIININKYGSLIKVLKIRFYVLKFVNIIYQKTFKKPLIQINIFDGELLWLRDSQYKDIIYDTRFDQWKKS